MRPWPAKCCKTREFIKLNLKVSKILINIFIPSRCPSLLWLNGSGVNLHLQTPSVQFRLTMATSLLRICVVLAGLLSEEVAETWRWGSQCDQGVCSCRGKWWGFIPAHLPRVGGGVGVLQAHPTGSGSQSRPPRRDHVLHLSWKDFGGSCKKSWRMCAQEKKARGLTVDASDLHGGRVRNEFWICAEFLVTYQSNALHLSSAFLSGPLSICFCHRARLIKFHSISRKLALQTWPLRSHGGGGEECEGGGTLTSLLEEKERERKPGKYRLFT